MQISAASLFVAVFLSGCAVTTPPEASPTTDKPEQVAQRCNTVLTGSRIPQCNRGDVHVVTREELERDPRWLHNPDPYQGTAPPK
jgi:hypothetical protein